MAPFALIAAPSLTTSRPLGLHLLPNGAGASFRVWAPNASVVHARLSTGPTGPFSPFTLQRDTTNQAYWSADISGVAAGNYYQFVITNRGGDKYNPGGSIIVTDPCARQVIDSNPITPAIVVDPTTFKFSTPFVTPRFENFIIYQSHVGSFAGRNDGVSVFTDDKGGTANFAQFQLKLDYIRKMKFNAVLFLPTNEYRGSEGEAYNPSDYYAPQVLYGDPDDLRRLVDASHSRGLAVFFDVVYNHMDPTHNLWQFDGNTDRRTDEKDPKTGAGIYFSTVETGFGRRPDHDSPDVQRFFTENAAMWFNEYHADGLRFDSASNFSEAGLQVIVRKLAADFPDKFIFAEDSDPNYIFNDVGGFNACWDMGSADGYAHIVSNRDISGLKNLIDHFGYPTAYSAIKYLLGSHDQIYNQRNDNGSWDKSEHETRYFVERIGGLVTGRDNWYARAQARMGWALNVAIPCTPMLFMGSECHHDGYWNPANDSLGDHRFDWNIAADPTSIAMRNMVRDVNAVRWDNPALRSDIAPLFPHFDANDGVLAFKRWTNEGNVLLTVVNLSDNQWADATYGVNIGGTGDRWQEIFNSQAPQYGGWQDSGNFLSDLHVGDDGRFYIRLPKWSVLIFRKD